MISPTKRFVLATAAALALFGCGTLPGSITVDEAAARLEQDQTPAGVEAALLRQFAAYQSGDMDSAFSGLLKECRLATDRFTFSKRVEVFVLAIETLTGSKLSNLRLRNVSVTNFTPERATAGAYLYLADGTLATSSADEGETVFYEDGRWRFDCP